MGTPFFLWCLWRKWRSGTDGWGVYVFPIPEDADGEGGNHRVIQATRVGVLSVIPHKNRITGSAASKKPHESQYGDFLLCLARGEKSERRDGISGRSTRKSSMVLTCFLSGW